MRLFTEPYQHANGSSCVSHPDYNVINPPDYKCTKCRLMWEQRCIKELGYKQMVALCAKNNDITFNVDDSYVLYWEESGKCKCISSIRHNFWFTVELLYGFHQRYSMVLGRE